MKTIVETVYNSDLQLLDHPENLLQFAEWLKEQMEKIPAEYGEDARIIWDNPYPDEGGVKCVIQYYRPKTEEELLETEEAIRREKERNKLYAEKEFNRIIKLYPHLLK